MAFTGENEAAAAVVSGPLMKGGVGDIDGDGIEDGREANPRTADP